jgi:hypothetical protein
MQSQSVRTDLYFFSFERGAYVSPSANAVGKKTRNRLPAKLRSARGGRHNELLCDWAASDGRERSLFAALICSLVRVMLVKIRT